jgi:hypothetical protein
MIDGVIIIVAFFVSFILHVIIHRSLCVRGIVTVKTISVYLVGLGIVIVGFAYGILRFPVTSFLLYGLAVLITSIYYLGACLDGETPADMILDAFTRKKIWKRTELQRLFSSQGLLWDRVDELIAAGLVKRHGARFVVTQKGKWITLCIESYQRLFSRPLGG